MALLERWFWPDLIILGGGVSKEYAKYSRFLTARAPIVTARYLDTSGIVGAALAREAATAHLTGGPRPAGPVGDPASPATAQAVRVAASLVIEDQPIR